MPYVRRTKRRPSVSKRLKIAALALLGIALVLTAGAMFLAQQERLARGAAAAESYTPAPLPSSAPVKNIAVIGDSYTGGSDEGGYEEANWVPQAAEALTSDAVEVRYSSTGLGGSGYISRGTADKAFGDVVQETFDSGTDIALFFGSINDRTHPVNEVGEAAAAAFAAAQERSPDATLVVVGPAWPSADVPAEVVALRDELESRAASAGAVWIDPLAEEWFFDRPELIGGDGIHPTDEGHAYMAEKFASHLEPLLEDLTHAPATST